MIDNSKKIKLAEKFWEKPLTELNDTEWELLCDGCGQCCLKTLEDEESSQLAWTRVICRYYDEDNSRCSCYDDRTELVPDCLDVRKMDIGNSKWMPQTCAYRLRYEGKPLPEWHPLLAGSRQAMEEEGVCVTGRAISEQYVHPKGYYEHIIRWVDT